MYYDLTGPSPKFKDVEVNGKLTFMPGADRHIRVYNFWIRAGTLEIGTLDTPFPNKVVIELQGDNTEEYFAFTNNIEAGNKNLVITGKATIYGRARTVQTRLKLTTYVGDDTLYVDTNLDWQAGEIIAISATNMRHMDKDTCVISSYDPGSGMVIC